MHQLPHDHGHQHTPMQTASFEGAAGLMKLMSDSSRMHLLWILCHSEECVINLSALLELSSPAVSHHLKLLKEAGLVVSRREGKEVYYTAARNTHTQVLHDMIEQTVELSCPAKLCFQDSQAYDSQTQVIHSIHDLLTRDLQTRYTIEELSARFHINPTTLKAQFKKLYGKPLAAHMKEHRIQKAVELLRGTDLTVGQIAAQVGYENQSKFTQAFKDITGVLPKDYRKENSHKG